MVTEQLSIGIVGDSLDASFFIWLGKHLPHWNLTTESGAEALPVGHCLRHARSRICSRTFVDRHTKEDGRYFSPTPIRAAMADARVIVVDFGVHYHLDSRKSSNKVGALHLIKGLDALAKLTLTAERTRGLRVLLREATPQHFPTLDGSGDYDAPRSHEKAGCTHASRVDLQRWRNRFMETFAAERHWGIMRLFDRFASRAELHKDARDCTHWCSECTAQCDGDAAMGLWLQALDEALRQPNSSSSSSPQGAHGRQRTRGAIEARPVELAV